MIEFKYRADVDGLRAVAVTLVLLYHAELGFRGGYIGVDIFFVISGFLITGLLLKEVKHEEFTLSRFWHRRIRRIMPASIVMVAATLIAGCFLLLPSDLKELSKSTIAQQAMLANVYYWRNVGYFDGPANLKPLLHTWSLAVEEQFYIVYPFVIYFLRRCRTKTIVTVLLAASIVSLALSELAVRTSPSTAFFMLPMRAWELLLGGLICFAPPIAQRYAERVSCLGTIGILVSALFFHEQTPFPGLTALVPCIGTALLIYANSNTGTNVGRMLASRPIVFVGLMSYSLYLWHWPVLVYLRYVDENAQLTSATRIAAVLITGALAYLSWKFIETPVRLGAIFKSRPSLFAATATCVGLLFAGGFALIQANGLPNRYDDKLRQVLVTMEETHVKQVVSVASLQKASLPDLGVKSSQESVLLWGDSHAMALLPAIDEACRRANLNGSQATYPSTLPLIGHQSKRKFSAPENYDQSVLDYISRRGIRVVILVGYWSRDAHESTFEQCVARTIHELTKRKCKVLIVRDVPDQKKDIRGIVLKAIRFNHNFDGIGVPLAEHRSQQAAADSAFLPLKNSNVWVVDPTPYFTENGKCIAISGYDCLYSDNNHLTKSGARRLVPMFESVFREMNLTPGPDSVHLENESRNFEVEADQSGYGSRLNMLSVTRPTSASSRN